MAEPATDENIMYIQVVDKSSLEGINQAMHLKLEDTAEPAKETPKEKPPKPDSSVTYQEKRIRCPECKYYTTENEEKMTRHIRKMHRGENPFQCYMCDYSTYNKVCFEEHVRVHQGIKPYKCSFCPHRTVSKKNMKKHELVHRPDNPLKCQLCEYFGRHRRALDFHMRKCHNDCIELNALNAGGGKLSCQRCGVKFENEDLLRAHNNLQHKCKECNFMGCSKSETKLHMIQKHKSVPPKRDRSKKAKEKTFKCAVCQWSSSHVARVLLHLIHHPDQAVDETVFDLTILRKHGIVR